VSGGLWAPERRALSAGLVLTVTLVAAEALAVGTVMPLVVRDLGGLEWYGWVFSAFFLANLVGIVIAGGLVDRGVGLAPPLVFGLACAWTAGAWIQARHVQRPGSGGRGRRGRLRGRRRRGDGRPRAGRSAATAGPRPGRGPAAVDFGRAEPVPGRPLEPPSRRRRRALEDPATMTPDELRAKIREIPDFPKPGILFYDITTLLKDPVAYRAAIDAMLAPYAGQKVDLVVGMESRGFIFSAPMAYQLGAGLVPVRKLGKLPAETISVEYALEYGSNTLEVHRDAIEPGQRVLIVDDLLATGGTVRGTVELVQRLRGEIVGLAFLVELTFLRGRDRLADRLVSAVIQY
jgi:adenine phosphoribosyltransferase